jgi:hypothetical protein
VHVGEYSRCGTWSWLGRNVDLGRSDEQRSGIRTMVFEELFLSMARMNDSLLRAANGGSDEEAKKDKGRMSE